jgi:hypothetical protein
VNLDRKIQSRSALGIPEKLSVEHAPVAALDEKLKTIFFKGVTRGPVIAFNRRGLGDGGK